MGGLIQHDTVTQLIYDDEFIIGELLVIILFNRQHKPDSTSPVLIIGAGPSGLSIGRLVTNNGIVDISRPLVDPSPIVTVQQHEA
jgi:hypothetical protein